jgi:hypothetical protein
MPKDGFALSVYGKLKMMYGTAEEAMTAASKLRQSYPTEKGHMLAECVYFRSCPRKDSRISRL